MNDHIISYLFIACIFIICIVGILLSRNRANECYKNSPKQYFLVCAIVFGAICIGSLAFVIYSFSDNDHSKLNENSSWNLKVMNAEQLEKYSTGAGQTIAFLDTGIHDSLREHLGDRIVSVYNAVDGSQNVNDMNGHGTSMVSVACCDGYKGVYGQAIDADLVIIKVTDDDGNTNNDILLDGLRFAQDSDATIVNISIGGYKTSDAVIEIIDSMICDGVSVIAASGDQGHKDLLFPASLDNVISVAAKQGDGSLWKGSNTSDSLTCAFPGYKITVLCLDGNDALMKGEDAGTSIACAIASSYVAQFRAYTNIDNNQMIVDMLKGLQTLSVYEVDYLQPFVNFKDR